MEGLVVQALPAEGGCLGCWEGRGESGAAGRACGSRGQQLSLTRMASVRTSFRKGLVIQGRIVECCIVRDDFAVLREEAKGVNPAPSDGGEARDKPHLCESSARTRYTRSRPAIQPQPHPLVLQPRDPCPSDSTKPGVAVRARVKCCSRSIGQSEKARTTSSG